MGKAANIIEKLSRKVFPIL